MTDLALRVILFCGITIASSALLAVPYLTIERSPVVMAAAP
jgi:hypothetical protein